MPDRLAQLGQRQALGGRDHDAHHATPRVWTTTVFPTRSADAWSALASSIAVSVRGCRRGSKLDLLLGQAPHQLQRRPRAARSGGSSRRRPPDGRCSRARLPSARGSARAGRRRGSRGSRRSASSPPTEWPPTTITSPTAGRSVCWIACIVDSFSGFDHNPRARGVRAHRSESLSCLRESTDCGTGLNATAPRDDDGPSSPSRPERLEAPFQPRSSGNTVTDVWTGTRGATCMNSSPSARVRFATDRTSRSPQRSSYGKRGDVAHVDAGADDGTSLRGRSERRGHELARRARRRSPRRAPPAAARPSLPPTPLRARARTPARPCRRAS